MRSRAAGERTGGAAPAGRPARPRAGVQPDRLAGLLYPAIPDERRAAQLLVIAAGAGVASQIAELASDPPPGWQVAAELALMVDQGLGDEDASWTTAAWAYALGVTDSEPAPLDGDPVGGPTIRHPGPVTAASAELRLRRTASRRGSAASSQDMPAAPDWAWIAYAVLLALAGAVFLYLAGFEFFRYGDPWSGAPALAAACVCIALIGRVWRRG